jgi:hypothetical protein
MPSSLSSFRPAPARPSARALALFGALWLGAGGCLPGDQRPAPGVVTVRIVGPEGLEARVPFTTDDGWAVTFDRVLVASFGVQESYSLNDLGGPEAGVGADCERYYDTSMVALYDLVAPGEKSLGRFAGLGECSFSVNWGWSTRPFDVLGPGVTQEDVTRVVTPTGGLSDELPVLSVVGVASKAGTSKSFTLPVSRFEGPCGSLGGRLLARLVEAGSLDLPITLHPERLLLDHAQLSMARSRFGPLAEADDLGDGDGAVTREEVAARGLDQLADARGAYTLPLGGVSPVFPPPEDVAAPRVSLLDFLGLQAHYVFSEGEDDLCDAGR